MNAFSRRGACPALSAPMQTGDGLLVRLNPVAGGISPKALIGLCKAALAHGNGVIEVTARGSLQIRGLTDESAPLFAAEIDVLGIAVRTGVPVETGRLAGLDPDEIADPTALAESIRNGIDAAGLSSRLGPKVSVVVDGGGRSGMATVAADARLEAIKGASNTSWRLSVAGDAATAKPIGCLDEAAASAAALDVLSFVADAGIDARARDLSSTQLDNLQDKLRSVAPPSVLPDISPSRGEIGESDPAALTLTVEVVERAGEALISPLEGEMSGRTEGGAASRETSPLTTFPLTDSRIALGVALPFGHTNAECLIAFAHQAEALGISDIRPAPQRTMLVLCPDEPSAKSIQTAAGDLGFVTNHADPRLHIAACPGKPACASGHIAAREVAATLATSHADILDGSFSLHISGCAKGCAHPGASTLTLTGSENGAGIVVGGTANSQPDAYTANDNLARAFGRVAGLIRGERRDGENAAACLSRIGGAKTAEAFGTR